jgi:hypothetical protein
MGPLESSNTQCLVKLRALPTTVFDVPRRDFACASDHVELASRTHRSSSADRVHAAVPPTARRSVSVRIPIARPFLI